MENKVICPISLASGSGLACNTKCALRTETGDCFIRIKLENDIKSQAEKK